MMPLAWRNRGPLLAPRLLSSQPMQSADARASPSATTRSHEPRVRRRRRRGSSLEAQLIALPSQQHLGPRPRPVTTAAAGSSSSSSTIAGRLSSPRGLHFPSVTAATSLREKRSKRSSSSSSSSSRIAAKRGDDEQESTKRGNGLGLLSRWAQLTAREKSVVVTFLALAVLFGPRLLLLSLVSLEAAATGALLAAERALGAAFLTSFVWLAGVAALLLAGLFVYFLILEEERLEDSSSSSDEE